MKRTKWDRIIIERLTKTQTCELGKIVGTAFGFRITLCPTSSIISVLKCFEQTRLPFVGINFTGAFLFTFSSQIAYISALFFASGKLY
jgi:hypothetical protein